MLFQVAILCLNCKKELYRTPPNGEHLIDFEAIANEMDAEHQPICCENPRPGAEIHLCQAEQPQSWPDAYHHAAYPLDPRAPATLAEAHEDRARMDAFKQSLGQQAREEQPE